MGIFGITYLGGFWTDQLASRLLAVPQCHSLKVPYVSLPINKSQKILKNYKKFKKSWFMVKHHRSNIANLVFWCSTMVSFMILVKKKGGMAGKVEKTWVEVNFIEYRGVLVHFVLILCWIGDTYAYHTVKVYQCLQIPICISWYERIYLKCWWRLAWQILVLLWWNICWTHKTWTSIQEYIREFHGRGLL